jgi:hypothetical protein
MASTSWKMSFMAIRGGGGDDHDDVRKTEHMTAGHLPVQHEEPASSRLFEQAMAQIRAGARVQIKTDENERVERAQTAPITEERLAQITATKDARPVIEMAPLARPPEGTPAPNELPRIPFEVEPASETPLQRKRMPRLVGVQRIATVHSPPASRSDARMTIAAIVVIVGAIATIAILLAS